MNSMNKAKQFVVALVAIGSISTASISQAQELFEFTGVSDGAAWNGAVDALANSGNYTFTGAGFIQELNNQLSMFQDDGGIPNGTLNPMSSQSFVLDLADNVQIFTVNSVDWRAFGPNGGNTASLIGYSGGSGGTEQWRISGPQDIDPPLTYGAPTTGSFGNPIDTIVWDLPDYLDGTFGHQLDNVSVNIIPEPTTFALAGLGLAGLLIARRRH